jgi:hypothetical protein
MISLLQRITTTFVKLIVAVVLIGCNIPAKLLTSTDVPDDWHMFW